MLAIDARTRASELNVGQAVAVEAADGGRVPTGDARARGLTGERLGAAASRARRAAQGRRERRVGICGTPVDDGKSCAELNVPY